MNDDERRAARIKQLNHLMGVYSGREELPVTPGYAKSGVAVGDVLLDAIAITWEDSPAKNEAIKQLRAMGRKSAADAERTNPAASSPPSPALPSRQTSPHPPVPPRPTGPPPRDQGTLVSEDGVVYEQLLGQRVERRVADVPVTDKSPGGQPNIKPTPGLRFPRALGPNGEGLFDRPGPIGPRRQWHPRTM